jgi:hypothetical protein
MTEEPKPSDGEGPRAKRWIKPRPPVATASLVAFLVVVFLVEQSAKIGDEGTGFSAWMRLRSTRSAR